MTASLGAVSPRRDPVTEDDVYVLAVGGDPGNLHSLEALLEQTGARLVTAQSGEEGLRYLQEQDFAVILLDVQLPGMDGIETARVIRAQSHSSDTPIIFLTADEHMPEQILRGYAVGAVDFLFKPLVPVIFKSKVAVFIDLYKKNVAVKRQESALRDADRRELQRNAADERARWEELRLREELVDERRLFAERERQVVTLRSIGDAVLATDAAGHITLLNPSAEALTGWTEAEALGASVDDVVKLCSVVSRKPRSLAAICESAPSPVPHSDSLLTRRDGTERVVTDSAAPVCHRNGDRIGSVVVLCDVGVQRQMEHDLQNAQRMETVGLLAGGIAHDFNNTLAVIMASSALARVNLPAGTQAERLLAEIEEACGRATALTRQLSTFARGGAPAREPCAIDRLVQDSVRFSLRGSSTACSYDFERGLWTADVDPGQIGQLLGNIVLNARDAMGDAGALRVRLRNHLVEPGKPGPLAPGRYVELAITDSGDGVPAELLDRIFDPYFTTKANGTGLGLASAYSIARRHDGLLRVESKPGDGATFLVYLPATEDAVQPVQDERAPDSALRASEVRVLLMDDEQWLRTIVAECLVEMGYRVVSTPDGQTAVELFRQAIDEGDPFDLAILDLTVHGGIGGVEVLSRLRTVDPRVRAVASSGYADDPVMASYWEHGFGAVLPKPFRFAALARAINQVLGGQAASNDPGTDPVHAPRAVPNGG